MFNPNDERVKKNLPKIKKALLDNNIEIYFQPSEKLRRLIMSGTHPMLKGICKEFASILISSDGIRIQKRMLFDWLNAVLDEKNSFIMSNGEVKIVGSDQQIKTAIENKLSKDQ